MSKNLISLAPPLKSSFLSPPKLQNMGCFGFSLTSYPWLALWPSSPVPQTVKAGWLFHLQPISGTASSSRCILGRTLHEINYSVEGLNPFTLKHPAFRARLKLWDTTFTENHDMALHKLGQEAVPKYASLAWLWPYGELHFPESKHWTQGLAYCKILCFSLCPLLQRLLKNLELH